MPDAANFPLLSGNGSSALSWARTSSGTARSEAIDWDQSSPRFFPWICRGELETKIRPYLDLGSYEASGEGDA